MANDAHEAAWKKFEDADVPALGPLCLFFASELDNDAFVKIQKRARHGKKDKRLKAIDELLEIAARYPSPMFHDGVIASALDDVDEHRRALDVRLAALAFTPSWHPMLAGQVVGNVGWSFQKLGELDAAKRFYERALRFDPTNPFVLSSLAEVFVLGGDVSRARGVRAYLAKHGTPASQTTELDALLAKQPGDAITPYEPGFDGLAKLDGRGWAKLCAFVDTDEETPPQRFCRAMAVGAAMRGEFGYARFFAEEAIGDDEDADEDAGEDDDDKENDDDEDEAKNADVDASWCRAIAAWLAPTGPVTTRVGKDRAEAFDAAVAAKDAKAVKRYLADPLPMLRVFACEAILDVDPNDEDARAMLEELERADIQKGVAARPLADNPAGFARFRLRSAEIGKQPLIRLGRAADDPVFAKLEKQEGLVFFLSFPRKRTDEDGAWFGEKLQAAATAVAKDDPKAELFENVNEQTVEICVKGAKQPANVITAFTDAFGGADTRLRELVYARYVLPDGKKRHLLDPVQSPASKQEDTKQTWKRSFDLKRPAPLSEPEDGPSFMMMQTAEGPVPEIRIPRFELRDVRVVYGLENVDQRDAAEAREREVRAAIDAAMRDAFRGQPPERMNRNGDRDGALDAIRFEGRDGFAFALEGMRPAFVIHYPRGFRFREHELLTAIAEATRTAKLAPVVQWARSSGTWIVNVWEQS